MQDSDGLEAGNVTWAAHGALQFGTEGCVF